MNLEKDLIQIISKSTNKEAAILTTMEVIHAELERLLSEPEFPLSDHQATSGKSE